MVRDRRMLLHEIAALIDGADTDHGPASVARLEHTLTSGYAHALALEGERLRLQQQLGETARRVHSGQSSGGEELAELAELISATDEDLMRLRALLLVLRDRAREARAAA